MFRCYLGLLIASAAWSSGRIGIYNSLSDLGESHFSADQFISRRHESTLEGDSESDDSSRLINHSSSCASGAFEEVCNSSSGLKVSLIFSLGESPVAIGSISHKGSASVLSRPEERYSNIQLPLPQHVQSCVNSLVLSYSPVLDAFLALSDGAKERCDVTCSIYIRGFSLKVKVYSH